MATPYIRNIIVSAEFITAVRALVEAEIYRENLNYA